eukprot:6192727-Pleurochrysis_carterae.AAC.4
MAHLLSSSTCQARENHHSCTCQLSSTALASSHPSICVQVHLSRSSVPPSLRRPPSAPHRVPPAPFCLRSPRSQPALVPRPFCRGRRLATRGASTRRARRRTVQRAAPLLKRNRLF